MGIFDSIRNAIFGHAQNNAAAQSTSSTPPPAPPSPAAGSATAAPPPPQAASDPVDVEATLNALVKKSSQQLNWRTSIVDLMKLLDLDSSLAHRKALAAELGYTGSTEDSAAMNVWLHKQVMAKLAQNGGKVPADLK
jgi:3-oxoacyl-ACP reductase-like protein